MANEVQTWKGAVEPAGTTPSGNEVQLWKGAVEPPSAAAAAGGTPLVLYTSPGLSVTNP